MQRVAAIVEYESDNAFITRLKKAVGKSPTGVLEIGKAHLTLGVEVCSGAVGWRAISAQVR